MNNIARFSNRRLSSINSMKKLRATKAQLDKAIVHAEYRLTEKLSLRYAVNLWLNDITDRMGKTTGMFDFAIKGFNMMMSLMGKCKKRKKSFL